MNKFIEWLEDLNSRDNKVRAILRRSLAFEPGTYIASYPYVEPFLREEEHPWRRKVFYLVAGLWAMHFRKDRRGELMSFGQACAAYQVASGSANIERRFITTLDSDGEQLPHRLRQMIALLKDQHIDFNDLLKGLLSWNDYQKGTQSNWAREFYRNQHDEVNAA